MIEDMTGNSDLAEGLSLRRRVRELHEPWGPRDLGRTVNGGDGSLQSLITTGVV